MHKKPLLINVQGKLLRNMMLHDFRNNFVEGHIKAVSIHEFLWLTKK